MVNIQIYSLFSLAQQYILTNWARIAFDRMLLPGTNYLVNIGWFFQFVTRTFLSVDYYHNDYEQIQDALGLLAILKKLEPRNKLRKTYRNVGYLCFYSDEHFSALSIY